MEYDFLSSPRERLSLHIERLGKIVSAVYMLSQSAYDWFLENAIKFKQTAKKIDK